MSGMRRLLCSTRQPQRALHAQMEPTGAALLTRTVPACCAGVERLIITAGNLEEARKALALARTHGESLSLLPFGGEAGCR